MTAQTLGLSVALVLGCASLGMAETKSIDRTLPLSADTRERLKRWAAKYDATQKTSEQGWGRCPETKRREFRHARLGGRGLRYFPSQPRRACRHMECWGATHSKWKKNL